MGLSQNRNYEDGLRAIQQSTVNASVSLVMERETNMVILCNMPWTSVLSYWVICLVDWGWGLNEIWLAQ